MNNAERYLEHLLQITGRRADERHQLVANQPLERDLDVLIYRDWPHETLITGFTYGLSEVDHPEWTLGRAELMLSIASTSSDWALRAGQLAQQLAGKSAFRFGETIELNAPITSESALDAFLVFAPPFLTNEQAAVPLDPLPCYITGLYPLYSSEIPLYERLGMRSFWSLPGWDPFNVSRPPLEVPAEE